MGHVSIYVPSDTHMHVEACRDLSLEWIRTYIHKYPFVHTYRYLHFSMESCKCLSSFACLAPTLFSRFFPYIGIWNRFFVLVGSCMMSDRLFAFMDATGCADLVTYNTLLKSFTATGQLAEAERVFAMMDGEGEEDDEGEADDDEKQEEQGQRAACLYGSPSGAGNGDEKVYTSDGTMRGKSKERRRRKIAPDAVTFNLLVNAAVSAGQLDKAWGYIDRLKKANLAVSLSERDSFLFFILSFFSEATFVLQKSLHSSFQRDICTERGRPT